MPSIPALKLSVDPKYLLLGPDDSQEVAGWLCTATSYFSFLLEHFPSDSSFLRNSLMRFYDLPRFSSKIATWFFQLS